MRLAVVTLLSLLSRVFFSYIVLILIQTFSSAIVNTKKFGNTKNLKKISCAASLNAHKIYVGQLAIYR